MKDFHLFRITFLAVRPPVKVTDKLFRIEVQTRGTGPASKTILFSAMLTR